MGSIVVRKKQNGEVVVEGDLPERHTFGARWIHRELPEGVVEVTVRIKTAEGDVTYTLDGFEEIPHPDDDTPATINYGAWVCSQIADKRKKKR